VLCSTLPLLYASEKYPEAVEVLEKAVKVAPDSPSLLLQLGSAYLKTSQNDKAAATLGQAIERKSDDPEMLNNVAYTLAESKVSLDLARQYAEKAVTILEEQSQGTESNEDVGLRVTYQFSLVWDTLGWVYFQQGDLKHAESLVRACWLLGEADVVGEHLGEIYEKEGKTDLAAHAYENALAVSSVPTVQTAMMPPPNLAMEANLRESNEIRARYKKLMGKDPALTEIHRLPNGEWSQTPAEKLRHSRELKLSNEGKLSGSAQFTVEFKPGKGNSASFVQGDEELKILSGKLESAHFPLEFPADSGAQLFVHVDVNCHPGASCIASLINPLPPAGQRSSAY
jgi:tetratricopeptide (TPR) repeat protein